MVAPLLAVLGGVGLLGARSLFQGRQAEKSTKDLREERQRQLASLLAPSLNQQTGVEGSENQNAGQALLSDAQIKHVNALAVNFPEEASDQALDYMTENRRVFENERAHQRATATHDLSVNKFRVSEEQRHLDNRLAQEGRSRTLEDRGRAQLQLTNKMELPITKLSSTSERLTELMNIVETNGINLVNNTPQSRRAIAIMQTLTADFKGAEFLDLGALQADDLPIVRGVIPDPSAPLDVLFSNPEALLQQFSVGLELVSQRLNEAGKRTEGLIEVDPRLQQRAGVALSRADIQIKKRATARETQPINPADSGSLLFDDVIEAALGDDEAKRRVEREMAITGGRLPLVTQQGRDLFAEPGGFAKFIGSLF